MKKRSLMVLALAALATSAAMAQQAPGSAAVVVSAPGKAAAVSVTELTASVVAIDKTTRTVTLKGPQGRTLDVVCGDEVKNFGQIRVGDQVTIKYQESLSLELRKVQAPTGAAATTVAARAAPGARPAGLVAREIEVLADVVAVDQAKSTISLKGPQGNVVDLKVQNPDHFKVVKVGDQVEAVYSQALAIAVTPPAKPAASTKK
jgi:hypothetical protein